MGSQVCNHKYGSSQQALWNVALPSSLLLSLLTTVMFLSHSVLHDVHTHAGNYDQKSCEGAPFPSCASSHGRQEPEHLKCNSSYAIICLRRRGAGRPCASHFPFPSLLFSSLAPLFARSLSLPLPSFPPDGDGPSSEGSDPTAAAAAAAALLLTQSAALR